jgi:hypothetical protein
MRMYGCARPRGLTRLCGADKSFAPWRISGFASATTAPVAVLEHQLSHFPTRCPPRVVEHSKHLPGAVLLRTKTSCSRLAQVPGSNYVACRRTSCTRIIESPLSNARAPPWPLLQIRSILVRLSNHEAELRSRSVDDRMRVDALPSPRVRCPGLGT